MKHHRKAFAVLLSGALTLSMVGTAVAAPEDVEEAPLYTWDGTGYTDVPVPYAPGLDNNQVMIPVEYQDVKNDSRSAWVGTIFNLHFPKTSGEEDFRSKYQTVLDNFAEYNMNTMIFQVRPEQDAWYPSEQGNPWSKYLTPTGVEGTDPGFDPLQIMVDMTHEAGMEYHAWLNPYRVTNRAISALTPADRTAIEAAGYTMADLEAATPGEHVEIYAAAGLLAADNFAVQHPQWVLSHATRLFLNPGVPEVQQHIFDTIAEIATNYDVDAIHFDDYFYPDGFGAQNDNPETAADAAQFAAYGSEFPDTTEGLNDWRRANTTNLVQGVHDTIGAINATLTKSVQFGISPAGIWDHSENDPRGSLTPTTSMSTYHRLFADTYTWVKEGMLDYVMPQIYWAFTTGAAPYGELARWWNNIAEETGVKVYVGHANYKVVPTSTGGEWSNPNEIPNQLKFNQTLGNVMGEGFYSYNDILPTTSNNVQTETQDIIKSYWDYTALVPAMDQLSHGVSAPSEVALDEGILTWTDPDPARSRFFVVYRGEGTPEEIIASPRNIVERIWAGDTGNFQRDVTEYEGVGDLPEGTRYVVTTTNAAGVESDPVAAEGTEQPVEPDVRRLGGSDRYATNLAVNEASDFPKGGSVFVVTGSRYADALSAAPAAAINDAPLFLTRASSVPQGTLDQISALEPSRVYVIGGSEAVSERAVSQIGSAAGVTPLRVGGVDRYDTSRKVMQAFFASRQVHTAFIATGNMYPDALSASAAAGALDGPVLLVNGKRDSNIATTSRTLMQRIGVETVAITGGEQAVNPTLESNLNRYFPDVIRLGGEDRYATNMAVNEHLNQVAGTTELAGVWIATGRGFPDALSAAPPAGKMTERLVLSNGKCIPAPVVSDWIMGPDSRVELTTLVGGTQVLPPSLEELQQCNEPV